MAEEIFIADKFTLDKVDRNVNKVDKTSLETKNNTTEILQHLKDNENTCLAPSSYTPFSLLENVTEIGESEKLLMEIKGSGFVSNFIIKEYWGLKALVNVDDKLKFEIRTDGDDGWYTGFVQISELDKDGAWLGYKLGGTYFNFPPTNIKDKNKSTLYKLSKPLYFNKFIKFSTIDVGHTGKTEWHINGGIVNVNSIN